MYNTTGVVRFNQTTLNGESPNRRKRGAVSHGLLPDGITDVVAAAPSYHACARDDLQRAERRFLSWGPTGFLGSREEVDRGDTDVAGERPLEDLVLWNRSRRQSCSSYSVGSPVTASTTPTTRERYAI